MNQKNQLSQNSNPSNFVPLPQRGKSQDRHPLPQTGKPSQKVTIEVGPSKGSKRLVIARIGNKEVHRDKIDTHAARSRKQFVEAILKARPALAGERERLDGELIKKSDEIDAKLEECHSEEGINNQGDGSVLDKAIALVETISLFKSPSEVAYADISTDKGRITLSVTSERFQQWLRQTLYAEHQIVISQSILDTAVQHIRALALVAGEVKPVYTRVASHHGNIYIDLGQSDGKAVYISKKGVNIVLPKNVRFDRKPQSCPLPTPIEDKKGTAVEEMLALLNLETKSDQILLLGFLVGCLNPNIPFPILAIHGPKGSAKSALMKLIKRVIDPCNPLDRDLPSSTQDLAIHAKNEWLPAFDNVSRLSKEMSDSLCRLATGFGFAKRKLYTDEEEAIIDVRRPTMFNGIPEVAIRHDLLDRMLTLSLPWITPRKRRTESDLAEEFERILPRFLTCLYQGVRTALRNVEQLGQKVQELPRLADFALFAMAAMPAFGHEPKEFLTAMNDNQKASAKNALEASPIFGPLSSFLQAKWKSADSYSATATELWEELNQRHRNERAIPNWPKSPSAFSGELRRLVEQLVGEGISISFSKSGSRQITFTKVT